MYFIHNKEEYLTHITRYCKTEKEKKSVIKEAYKVALDTRKFEIELYWKRATYFWGFLVATFAAYFLLSTRGNTTNNSNDDNYILLVLLSLLGFFISVGWYFVNRGSKVWQENWEKHISFLEDGINGPLFKTIIVPNLKFYKLQSGYPNSVSKVNMVLSLVIVFFWFFVFTFSVFKMNFKTSFEEVFQPNYIWIGYVLISIGIILFIFFIIKYFNKYTKSFKYRDLKDHKTHISQFNPTLYFVGKEPTRRKKGIIERIRSLIKQAL
ncbi:hypothetical protein CMU93_01595 [Elizabethkingia anophelis]|nr:hypothetical protein [Elizabethkingia anophelis]